MKTRILSFMVFGLLMSAPVAQAKKIVYTLPDAEHITAMRRDPTASSGVCTVKGVKTVAQAKILIDYYDIKTKGANDNELKVLAAALYQASIINGGRFEPFTDISMEFASRTGASRFLNGSKTIQINRCDSKGNRCGDLYNINVARMSHELGHAFGHVQGPNGVSYYDEMAKRAGSCYPTRYSDDNIRERTAEIVSAFLTRPRILNGTQTCQGIFDYFSQKVFKGNGTQTTCDEEKLANLKKRFRNLTDSDTKESLDALFAERQ